MGPLHSMTLHDELAIDNFTMVRRVPGGWIYHYATPYTGCQTNEDYRTSSVFVPYSPEFSLPLDSAREQS